MTDYYTEYHRQEALASRLSAENSSLRKDIAELRWNNAELKRQLSGNRRLVAAGTSLIARLEKLSGTIDLPLNIRPYDIVDEYSALRRALLLAPQESGSNTE